MNFEDFRYEGEVGRIHNLGCVEYFSLCNFTPPTELITEGTTVDTRKELLKITKFQTSQLQKHQKFLRF